MVMTPLSVENGSLALCALCEGSDDTQRIAIGRDEIIGSSTTRSVEKVSRVSMKVLQKKYKWWTRRSSNSRTVVLALSSRLSGPYDNRCIPVFLRRRNLQYVWQCAPSIRSLVAVQLFRTTIRIHTPATTTILSHASSIIIVIPLMVI